MINFRAFIPAVAVVLSMAAPVFADSVEPLRIQNNSGQTIYRFFASPVNNSNWENDILGNNTLGAGQHLDITFRNVSECNYDILVEFENGGQFTDVVNICQIGQYNVNR
jgi:hypothetical protein